MKKSYNDIMQQATRLAAACRETGRFCDNAKKRLDMQRLAQIRRAALVQHDFPIFGDYDKDEKRPCRHENPVQVVEKNETQNETQSEKTPAPTPTEKATERVMFTDWMNADAENRKQIQQGARHAFVKRMYAELLTDMQICKIEGWDVMEFPRMIRQALQVCFPKKPVQLALWKN